MKALTVRQPHAQLILLREKTIELRSWTTRHRGPLLICAGARADFDLAYPLGVALCLVDLVDVRPYTPADSPAARSRWRAGLYAWDLASPRAVAQIPIKGALGLFAVPAAIAAALQAAPAKTESPPATAPSRPGSDRAATRAPA